MTWFSIENVPCYDTFKSKACVVEEEDRLAK